MRLKWYTMYTRHAHICMHQVSMCIHKLVTPSKLNYDMLHYKHRFEHCFDVLPVLLDNATKTTTTITSMDTPNDRGLFCFFAT